jgi:CHASE3 domain sensor protein
MGRVLFLLILIVCVLAVAYFVWTIYKTDKENKEKARLLGRDYANIDEIINSLKQDIRDQENLAELGIKTAEEKLEMLREQLKKIEEIKRKLS